MNLSRLGFVATEPSRFKCDTLPGTAGTTSLNSVVAEAGFLK